MPVLRRKKRVKIDLNSCNCDTISTDKVWHNITTGDVCYTTTTATPINWMNSAGPSSTLYGIAGEFSGESSIQASADQIHINWEGKRTLKDALDDLRKCCDENTETFKNFETLLKDKEGEENNMFENLNFEFGPVNKNRIQMSPFGMAVSVGSNSKGTRK